MIEVNLLPIELRPKEHTPYPRLLVILFSVVIVFVQLFGLVAVHMKRSRVADEIEALSDEITRQTEPANRTVKLEKELKVLQNRVAEVDKKEEAKILFHREILALARHLPNNVAWCNKLELFLETPRRGAKKGKILKLTMETFVNADLVGNPLERTALVVKNLVDQNQNYSRFAKHSGGKLLAGRATVVEVQDSKEIDPSSPASVVSFKLIGESAPILPKKK